MFDLFNALIESLPTKDMAEALKNCTIKVVENGKPVIDIENGVDKLAEAKKAETPKVRNVILSSNVRVVNSEYYIKKRNYTGEEKPYWKIPFADDGLMGITNEDLLTILVDRFRNCPKTLEVLNKLRAS